MAAGRAANLGRFGALAALGAGLFFVHVWLNVDPRLIYHRQGPLFWTGWEFLGDSVSRPGGPADYVSALLAQWHWLGWPGAAALTLAALVAVAALRVMLTSLGRWADVPALALLVPLAVLTNRYAHPATTVVGLATALVVAALFKALAPRRTAARLAGYAAAAVLLDHAAGSAVFLFAGLAAIGELAAPEDATRSWPARSLAAAACLAVAAFLPYAATVLFGLRLSTAYGLGLPFARPQDPAGLAVSVALYAVPILAFAWAALAARRPAPTRVEGLGRRLAPLAAAAALLAAGTVLAVKTLDPLERSILRVDWCAAEGRWEELLAEPAAHSFASAHVEQSVVRALSHTHRLLDDLFAYPLSGESPPLPGGLDAFFTSASYRRLCEELLDLGQVCEAEHAAYEALEVGGEQPRLLRYIVYIYVAKGQPEAARPFLGRLRRSLWHRAWAEEIQRSLEADPRLAGDPEIERLRRRMPTTDLVGNLSREPYLVELLRRDPSNRMAAEYLMLSCLVARRPERVVENLALLQALPGADFPRHVQEAVLEFAWRHPDAPIRTYGRRLTAAKAREYRRFLACLAPHANDAEGAWNAAKGEFGATYWFFSAFGCTAAGRDGPPLRKKESPQ